MKCNITFKVLARRRSEVNFFWGKKVEFLSGARVELIGDGVEVGRIVAGTVILVESTAARTHRSRRGRVLLCR